MNIRPADASDALELGRVVSQAFRRYISLIGKPPAPMLEDHGAQVRRHTAWVAELNGSVVGVLVLVPEEQHLEVDNLAVDPAHQRRGIGRALLAFAEREAERRGYRELRLCTNQKMTENLILYPALGWEETGRGEQLGYHRVFFRKFVSAAV